jgi:hypothetical protein
MTSCGDIDLLRDLGPVWEPGFPQIGSFVPFNFLMVRGLNYLS